MTDMLTDKEIEQARDILVEQLGVNKEQVLPEAHIEADLGADSLDKVEITMKTEEQFGLTIPDDAAEKVQTVGDLYETIATLLGRRPS